MKKQKSKRIKKNNQKVKLQDEVNTTREEDIAAIFEISSNHVEIPLHNLVKYSQIVQEEIKKNDIFSELSNNIQKVRVRNKDSINSFLQLLNDKETEIKNEEFTDLLKLAEFFKVEALKNILKKYLQNHSKDVDFILSLKIEHENSKEEISILSDDVSEEMEKCLRDNINECLQNDKIGDISVSSVYRMIEKGNREHISYDLLCHFIVESIKERYALFHFVDAEQLSDEAFEELINYYSKYNSSENNQIRFFDFLPSNLTYIKKLKEKQKLLETKIQDLEKINEDIKKENEQHKLQNDELKIINQQLEAQMKEEINRKNQEIDKMKKTNQQIETRYKEELSQKNQEIDKMKKNKSTN